ncbi:MAG: porin [Polyangiaceae bacterium]
MKQTQLSGPVLSLIVLALAAPAVAQDPPPPPPPVTEPPPEPPPPPPPAAEPTPLAGAPAAEAPPPAELKWYEPVASPLKIETPTSNIKFGLLLQPQFESLGSPTLDGMSNNLFLRRTRVLIGGALFKDLEFFFETESANLFKAGADGQKASAGVNVQDAFLTYKFLGDQLKLDVGYMLTPNSHNALQSAASLFGLDYFAYSFLHSNSFNSATPPAGRDLGLQLRGLVVDGLLEYRLGMFQGLREPASEPPADVASQNMFRVMARLQLNLFDPETGFFYGGTYLGAKKVLSFGAAFDFQDEYKYFALDGLLDMPLGPGVITAQVNFAQWDGGEFIPALVKQNAIMAEAGYTFAGAKLAPILRFETRNISDGDAGDETRISAGLSYWAHGHNFNVKAFFTRVGVSDPGEDYNAFNLQTQLFVF